MRVIGYLDTEGYKTTVFKNNDRFIVKFESGLYEQVFKFREAAKIENLNNIKDLIDADFLKEVDLRFIEMHDSKVSLLRRFMDTHEDTWEEIV
jgi:hypothetical protein